MSDEIDLNAYLSSPYSKDLRKQQIMQRAAEQNRRLNESIEAYQVRMAKFREENQQRLIDENTDILKERLANLDISNIGTKNRQAIEYLISQAQAIRQFAYNNAYNIDSIDFTTLNKAVEVANARLRSLKNGNGNSDLGTSIYADTYKAAQKQKETVLDKIFNKGKS